jgi:CHAT domain-containing protein
MAEQTPTYDELNIRIQPGDGERYHVVVSAADGSTASGAFAMPFNEVELDNFVLRVGRQRTPVRGYRSTQMEEAKKFGALLFEALLKDGVRDVFRAARAVADRTQKGLRVTLCLTDVPELMDVPWEFLYERPRFLAQSIFTPVVRSLDLTEVPSPFPLELPLTVLGMVSAPQGYDMLDVEHEKEKLAAALKPLCDQGLVRIEWLRRGTLRELDDAISRREETHVFHYIGHGGYDSEAQGGILLLEDERGGPHEATGEELGLLLQDERSLRLAVLNSCEGARGSHLDPFSGVASSLVQYGIPAVIGMQFEITDKAAIAFAARLYDSLAQSFPVDAAVAQSRRSIFAAGNDIEFGTPVLFLRGADARVFEVLDAPPPTPIAVRVNAPPAVPEPPMHPAAEEGDLPVEETEAPAYVSWLPRPWQDWWLRGVRSNLVGALRRVSNRKLILISVLLLIAGTIYAGAYGHENAQGERQSTLAGIVVGLGLIGLVWVCVRIVLARIRRFRDWWTGNG